MPIGGVPEPVDPGPEPAPVDAGGTAEDSGATVSDDGPAASDPGTDPGAPDAPAVDVGSTPEEDSGSGDGGCAHGTPAGWPLLMLCFGLAVLSRRRSLHLR